MDWSRAKTYLIAAFLILDVLLGYQYWGVRAEEANYVQSYSEQLNVVKELLTARHIQLLTDVPRQNPDLGFLRVEYDSADPKSVAEHQTGDFNPRTTIQAGVPFQTDNAVFLYVQPGVYEKNMLHPLLLNLSDSKGVEHLKELLSPYVWRGDEYQPDSLEIQSGAVNESASGSSNGSGTTGSAGSVLQWVPWQSQSLSGLASEQDTTNIGAAGQGGQKGSSSYSGKLTAVRMLQTYKGYPIFSAQLLVKINDGKTVTSFTQYCLNVLNEEGDKRAVIPALDALRSFMDSTALLAGEQSGDHKDASGLKIFSIQLGYYSNKRFSVGENEWYLAPMWRIQTDKGAYYVNGITGEVQGEERE